MLSKIISIEDKEHNLFGASARKLAAYQDLFSLFLEKGFLEKDGVLMNERMATMNMVEATRYFNKIDAYAVFPGIEHLVQNEKKALVVIIAIKKVKDVWDLFCREQEAAPSLKFNVTFFVKHGYRELYKQAFYRGYTVHDELDGFAGLIAAAQRVYPEMIFEHKVVAFTVAEAVEELKRLWDVYGEQKRTNDALRFNMSFITGEQGNSALYHQAQDKASSLQKIVKNFDGLVKIAQKKYPEIVFEKGRGFTEEEALVEVKRIWDMYLLLSRTNKNITFCPAFFYGPYGNESLYQQVQKKNGGLHTVFGSIDGLIAAAQKKYPEIVLDRGVSYTIDTGVEELKRIWDRYIALKDEGRPVVFNTAFIKGPNGNLRLFEQARLKGHYLHSAVGGFMGLVIEAQKKYPEIELCLRTSHTYTKQEAIEEVKRLWDLCCAEKAKGKNVRFNMAFVTGKLGNKNLYYQAQIHGATLQKLAGSFDALIAEARKKYPMIVLEKVDGFTRDEAVRELERLWHVFRRLRENDPFLRFNIAFITGPHGNATLYKFAQEKGTSLQKEIGNFARLMLDVLDVLPLTQRMEYYAEIELYVAEDLKHIARRSTVHHVKMQHDKQVMLLS